MGWFKRLLFKKELQEHKEEIKMLNKCIAEIMSRELELIKDLEEQIEFNQLYEQEVTRLEKENHILTLIVGSLKLYEGGNK